MDDGPIAFVVDDEAQWRSLVSGVLTSSGYETQSFETHAEMAFAFSNRRPHLLVLDLSLGDSDGVEVIRYLAAARFSGSVLLMSGHGEKTISEVQKIAERHGLHVLPPLSKPFRIIELRQRLSALSTQKGEELDQGLEAALQNNWLEVWYQPKINLKTGLVGGAEALVRLRHPKLGLFSPSTFLPPPGDPLYVPLTEFVARRAMRDWPSMAVCGMIEKLAINVPASVLQRPQFVTNLTSCFPKVSNFPGLIVEITEDETIADLELAQETAVQLRLHDVYVSIDDFGTGFSTMGRLTELPFSEIKLDQSFVQGCAKDPRKLAMCQTVAEMARRFEITAVAEGVETTEELRIVADLGYDMAQGFLYAKPMILDDFIAFLRSHKRRH